MIFYAFILLAFFRILIYITKSENDVKKKVIPPGIEPGTLSVLDSRDNRYTMESQALAEAQISAYMSQHKCTPGPLPLAPERIGFEWST